MFQPAGALDLREGIHDIAVKASESLQRQRYLNHVNGSPVLRNDPAANELVREVATSLFGKEQVGTVNPFMGSEDLPSC